MYRRYNKKISLYIIIIRVYRCAYKTYISDFFYIGDLRSGHFCDLPIISQWAKNQLRYIYFGASLFEWNNIV